MRAFDKNCLLRLQEDRQITKEEGSKEEDRQDCYLVFRRIGEYTSVDLFYFVNLTSSCSLIPPFFFLFYLFIVKVNVFACKNGSKNIIH